MDDTVGYYCYKASIFHFMSTPNGILKILSAKNPIKLIVQKRLIVWSYAKFCVSADFRVVSNI